MPGKSCNCQVSRNSPFRKLTALKHLSSVGRSSLWILSSWAQSKFDAKRKQHVTSQPPTSSSVWSCASKLASCGCDVHAVGVGSPDQLRARLVRSSLSGHGLGKVEKLHDSSRKKKLPFPPFVLKMEGPASGSCHHGCKTNLMLFSCYKFSTTN